MNSKLIKLLIILPIAVVFICAVSSVQNNYVLSTGYTVTINGTSNLHDWNETVGSVAGSSNINWNTDGSFDLAGIKLEMNVSSIKSSEGSIMNSNTYKALKGDANPEITIALISPVKSIQLKSGTVTTAVPCNITIAGVTKPVSIQVKMTAQDHAKLEFDGVQVIHMTDYGIAPPTALFGTLKTGNDITINFKTTFTLTNN